MSHLRDHFPEPWLPMPQALAFLDVGLLLRPPEHAPTLAEAIAAICSGHGDAS